MCSTSSPSVDIGNSLMIWALKTPKNGFKNCSRRINKVNLKKYTGGVAG